MRNYGLPLFLLASFMGPAGCGEDPDPAMDGTSSTSTTTGDGSSSSPGSTTDESSSSSTGPAGPRTCKRECELPATCCQSGQADCPSQTYPGNYGCENNTCVPPACANDTECEGEAPGTTCHEVNGRPECVRICDTDPTVCEADGQVCVGQSDAGQAFCRESCTDGTVLCLGGSSCDDASGLCLCDDGQCSVGFICR